MKVSDTLQPAKYVQAFSHAHGNFEGILLSPVNSVDSGVEAVAKVLDVSTNEIFRAQAYGYCDDQRSNSAPDTLRRLGYVQEGDEYKSVNVVNGLATETVIGEAVPIMNEM